MSENAQVFSYEEALGSFPQVRDLTERAIREIEAIVNQLQSRTEMEDRREEIEEATNGVIQSWVAEVTSLGCEVKGLWLVDWDCGDGFYCWKYPEGALSHFHGYEEGFEKRVPIN